MDWLKIRVDATRWLTKALKIGAYLAVIAVISTSLLLLGGAEMFNFLPDKYYDTDDVDGDGNIDAEKTELLIHKEINDRREEAGLSALSYDADLATVASGHSEHMADEGFFAHEGPNGDGFRERYADAGYYCEVNLPGDRVSRGSENIYKTWIYEQIEAENGTNYYASEESLAKGVVDGWMQSPSHRDNILTEHWRVEGIGVTITEYNDVYVTQNFC